ncbi:cupin domain-containing protein [Pseudanabaena sp. FACHB-1998]|uniref:cupin domain-containing protein n=1 Tax=Pseudanabaena sp. FACHB-1998 TaxID=2692858 RepID=UPI00168072B4|nr:cupin domain-containing protein [Pseudanabaena sp. FACHB-1998]MBD2176829.1 cupin domain-containing protein [Pseudanabaena sp. FACHB-1998]
MIINQQVRIFPELLTRSNYDDFPWEAFREGVEIYRLYKDDTGASAALLRYEAGAKVPHHSHSGYEHIFVLSGSQSDAHGKYTKGSVIINPPNTSHQVQSEEGCIVLIVWERPVIIHE